MVRLDLRAIDEFARSAPVARTLVTYGQRVNQAAKKFAPVSPHGSHGRRSGYGRSQIRMRPGQDGTGPYVDVLSPATTPRSAPYMFFQEVGTRKMVAQPHLRPALDTVFPGTTGVSPNKRGHARKSKAARRGSARRQRGS